MAKFLSRRPPVGDLHAFAFNGSDDNSLSGQSGALDASLQVDIVELGPRGAPYPHDAVFGGGGDLATVGAERDLVDRASPFQHGHDLVPGLDRPDGRGAIVLAHRQPGAVGAECEGGELIAGGARENELLPPGPGAPDLDAAVARIGVERHCEKGSDRAGRDIAGQSQQTVLTCVQRPDRLARPYIEHGCNAGTRSRDRETAVRCEGQRAVVVGPLENGRRPTSDVPDRCLER